MRGAVRAGGCGGDGGGGVGVRPSAAEMAGRVSDSEVVEG